MQKPHSTLGVSLSHDKKVAIFRSCDERRTEKKNLTNKRLWLKLHYTDNLTYVNFTSVYRES